MFSEGGGDGWSDIPSATHSSMDIIDSAQRGGGSQEEVEEVGGREGDIDYVAPPPGVDDELEAYGGLGRDPYWGYAARVGRYVAGSTVPSASLSPSEFIGEVVEPRPVGSAVASSTVEDRCVNGGPFLRGCPHSKERVSEAVATGLSPSESMEWGAETPHTVTERLGKSSPMKDFDAELLEIIKAYYECRRLGFLTAVDVEHQHREASVCEACLLADVTVGCAPQGGAASLSPPEPQENFNDKPQDLSLTQSTTSHTTAPFPETQPVNTPFFGTHADLLQTNGPSVAAMSGGAGGFHRMLFFSNEQAVPCLTAAASNTDPVLRRCKSPWRFSRSGPTERDFSASFPSSSPTSFVRAYVLDMNINLKPAILVTGLAGLLNIIVVGFLQNHVLDTRDHLGLFLVGSYLTFASYYMIYYFLERDSSSFRRIVSTEKKFYIIGNLIKAGILISITPFAMYHLLRIVLYDEWESNILRNLGCIFTLPDFVSMIIVKRMRWSTWTHHLCVVVFNYFSIMNDYEKENIFRCIVVYAGFSSFGYCVNVLLASRFLGLSASVARVLSFVALVVYGLCCSINWSWQVYYVLRLMRKGNDLWSVYLYLVLICFVVWDDIVLNKWLLNHAKNMAYAASKQK